MCVHQTTARHINCTRPLALISKGGHSVGRSESETTMGRRTPEHPTPLAGETGGGDGEKEEEVKRWVSFAPSSTGQLMGEGRSLGL